MTEHIHYDGSASLKRKQRLHEERMAAISNAVTEGETISLKDAVECIKWLQKGLDDYRNHYQHALTEISLAAMKNLPPP